MGRFVMGVLIAAVLLQAVLCDGDQTQDRALPHPLICPLRPCILPADCQLIIPPDPEDPCACPTCALDCRTVLCALPTCPNPVTPKGQCCPVCPKPTGPPDCSAVLCLRPDCPNPVVPEGECCGVCPDEPTDSPIDCSLVRCAFPRDCLNPVVPEGQCCPICPKPTGPPDCSAVLCLRPDCPNPVVPEGECCGVCPDEPTDSPIDCSLVRCAFPRDCLNPVVPEGQCCPICPKPTGPPDCSAVLCLRPDCPNPVVPEGECCGVCPEEPTEPEEESCPIEGQVFMECGTACPPTCAKPSPRFCTLQCVVGCQCPRGTVLDEVANKCVPVKKCKPTGPPDCSAVLCLRPDCPNPVVPEGECCGVCPEEPTEPEEESCPIEGQVFTKCGTACPPTCAEPSPGFCTLQCVVGCQCPRGTVLDEVANKCVRVKKCTCPPDCTRDFCVANPRAKCNIPGPREIPGCFGQCQLTFCRACYFSEEARDLPGNCGDCGSPVTSKRCLRRWSRCIRRADIRENGRPDPSCITQEKFKCYRYPCQLRG